MSASPGLYRGRFRGYFGPCLLLELAGAGPQMVSASRVRVLHRVLRGGEELAVRVRDSGDGPRFEVRSLPGLGP